jgi:hypothetical protein
MYLPARGHEDRGDHPVENDRNSQEGVPIPVDNDAQNVRKTHDGYQKDATQGDLAPIQKEGGQGGGHNPQSHKNFDGE